MANVTFPHTQDELMGAWSVGRIIAAVGTGGTSELVKKYAGSKAIKVDSKTGALKLLVKAKANITLRGNDYDSIVPLLKNLQASETFLKKLSDKALSGKKSEALALIKQLYKIAGTVFENNVDSILRSELPDTLTITKMHSTSQLDILKGLKSMRTAFKAKVIMPVKLTPNYRGGIKSFDNRISRITSSMHKAVELEKQSAKELTQIEAQAKGITQAQIEAGIFPGDTGTNKLILPIAIGAGALGLLMAFKG